MADLGCSVVSLGAKVVQYITDCKDAPIIARSLLKRAESCAVIAERVQSMIDDDHDRLFRHFPREVGKIQKGLHTQVQACLCVVEQIRKDLQPFLEGPRIHVQRAFYPFKKDTYQRRENEIHHHLASFNTYLAILHVYCRNDSCSSRESELKRFSKQGVIHEAVSQTIEQVFGKDEFVNVDTDTCGNCTQHGHDPEAQSPASMMTLDQNRSTTDSADPARSSTENKTQLKAAIQPPDLDIALSILVAGPCHGGCILSNDKDLMIHYAVLHASNEVLEILLQHSKLCTNLVDERDERKRTPLMLAAEILTPSHLETAQLLLSYQCDVNALKNGENALSIVVRHTNQSTIKLAESFIDLLLDYDADKRPALELCASKCKYFRQFRPDRDQKKEQQSTRRMSTGNSTMRPSNTDEDRPQSKRRHSEAVSISSVHSNKMSNEGSGMFASIKRRITFSN